jgi:hypothetical protein
MVQGLIVIVLDLAAKGLLYDKGAISLAIG